MKSVHPVNAVSAPHLRSQYKHQLHSLDVITAQDMDCFEFTRVEKFYFLKERLNTYHFFKFIFKKSLKQNSSIARYLLIKMLSLQLLRHIQKLRAKYLIWCCCCWRRNCTFLHVIATKDFLTQILTTPNPGMLPWQARCWRWDTSAFLFLKSHAYFRQTLLKGSRFIITK